MTLAHPRSKIGTIKKSTWCRYSTYRPWRIVFHGKLSLENFRFFWKAGKFFPVKMESGKQKLSSVWIVCNLFLKLSGKLSISGTFCKFFKIETLKNLKIIESKLNILIMLNANDHFRFISIKSVKTNTFFLVKLAFFSRIVYSRIVLEIFQFFG